MYPDLSSQRNLNFSCDSTLNIFLVFNDTIFWKKSQILIFLSLNILCYLLKMKEKEIYMLFFFYSFLKFI